MANGKRNIRSKTWITKKNGTAYKFFLVPARRIGTYIPKMAIDGDMFYPNTTNMKA